MRPRDRKLAILRQLSQEAEPMALSSLSERLGGDFPIRSVRRWVLQLMEEGLVQRLGHTKGARYVAVRGLVRMEEAEVASKTVSSCFSSESIRAIRRISRPLFERGPVTYNSEWFDLYEPNRSFYLPYRLRQQLFSAGQRAHQQDPAGTYAHKIYHRLMIDLSYNSSRLEGNTYSLLDTERLLLHGDSAAGKLDIETVMILNHKEAIRYLIENAVRGEVSRNVICTLHYLLADEPIQINI